MRRRRQLPIWIKHARYNRLPGLKTTAARLVAYTVPGASKAKDYREEAHHRDYAAAQDERDIVTAVRSLAVAG